MDDADFACFVVLFAQRDMFLPVLASVYIPTYSYKPLLLCSDKFLRAIAFMFRYVPPSTCFCLCSDMFLPPLASVYVPTCSSQPLLLCSDMFLPAFPSMFRHVLLSIFHVMAVHLRHYVLSTVIAFGSKLRVRYCFLTEPSVCAVGTVIHHVCVPDLNNIRVQYGIYEVGVRGLTGSGIFSFSCPLHPFWIPPGFLSNRYRGPFPQG
jgi:hypothetical protein